MTNIKLALFTLAVVCGVTSVQADVDWTWHGDDGAYTSGGDSSWWNYSATTPPDYLVFQGDAFNKTIVFDNSLAPTKGVYVGRHSGGDYPADQVSSVVWQAISPEYGISSAPEGLFVSGYGGCPICQLRIEGGSYTFGTKSDSPAAWDGVAAMIGTNNDGSLELVAGTVTCLNNLWIHSRTEDKHGSLVIGDGTGVNAATVTVDRAAVTKLADNNGYYGSLVLRKGGVLETSFIVWNSSSGTLTLDGGTIAKIGNMKTDTRYTDVNEQADLLCGNVANSWNYSGTSCTIQMTANGGTIRCDSPALLQSPIALAVGVASAVLTKTGAETLKLVPDVIPSGMGLNIQEGAVQIDHWASRPSSLEIGENGRFEVCCNPGSVTVVGAGVPFTYPVGANLKDLIVPVGSGFVDYSVTYTDEAGLVITTSDTPLEPVDPPTSSLITTVDGFKIKRRSLGENETGKEWNQRIGKFPDGTPISTLVDATNAFEKGYIVFNYDAELFGGELNADVVACYNGDFVTKFDYDKNGGTGGGYPGGRDAVMDAAFVTANGQITVPSAGKWTFCVGARENSYVSLSIKGTGIDDVYETWLTTPNNGSLSGEELKLVTVDFPTANATYDVEILQYSSNSSIWLEFSAAKGEYTAFDANEFVLVGDTVTEYTVTFNSDGGSTVAAQTVRGNRTATRPADPTKSGYTFDGWTLNDAAYDFSTPVKADITLVAQWAKNEEPDEPTHEHVWGEWEDYTHATATTPGERRRYCTADGCTNPVAFESEVIPATGGGDDPIIDPPTTGTEYHWMGAAPDPAVAPHILAWTNKDNWTDANGNAVNDYPHQAGDIAVFHGMAQGYVAEIAAGETIVLDELRFAEGNSLLGCSLTAHVVVGRLVISEGAVWELASDDSHPQYYYQTVTMRHEYDFTVNNHAEIMANDAACIRGALGHRTYKPDVNGETDGNTANFNTRMYVTLDEDGKLIAEKPSTEWYNAGDWGQIADYGYAVGVFFAGNFPGVALGPHHGIDGGGQMTVLSGQYVFLAAHGYLGKESDMVSPSKGRGCIRTPSGIPLYMWGRGSLTDLGYVSIHTAVNSEKFINSSYATTVIYSDHTADAVADYVIAAGTLSLGGTVYDGSIDNSAQKTCSMNACDYTVAWSGTLAVECENPFNANSSIDVRSYNQKGNLFGKISLAHNGTVKNLLIDGIVQPAGTYGSTSSAADNKNDAIFTGTGVLTVTSGAAPGVSSTVISTLNGFTMRRRCVGGSPTTLVEALTALEQGNIIRSEENCHSPSQTVVVAGYHAEFTGRFNYDGNGGVDGGYPGMNRYDRSSCQLIGATGKIVVPSAGKWTFCVGAREDSYVSLSIKGVGIDDVFEMWQTGPNQLGVSDGEVYLVTVDFPTANAAYEVEILQYSSNADIWLEFSATKGEYTAFDANEFVLVGDTVTEYTVTFDSDGGSEVAAQTVRENRTATCPTDPTKSGYTFDGWTLNDAAYDFSTPVTADITLVAQWSENEEPVEDVVKPAIGTVTSSVNGQNVTISLADVVKGTGTDGTVATTYDVYAQAYGSDTATKVVEVQSESSASFTFENLANGAYTYSVYIINDRGVQSESKSVTFVIGSGDVPGHGDNPVDWTWKGPDGGSTTTEANWNNYTLPIGHMVFNGDTSGTIVFADSYELNNGLWVGCHGGSWPSTQTNSFTWRAVSDSCGVSAAPDGFTIAGYGGSPVCLLRIEGGSYTVGNPDNIKWDSVGIQVGSDNYGELELVSGEIDCQNIFYVHSRTGSHSGRVIIGDGVGEDTATISVTNIAMTVLGQGLQPGNCGTLIIRKGGALETSFIDWATDDSTLTLDGGTIVKNGDLSQIALLSGYPENKQFTLFASHYGYSGTDREIYLTENGGTFKCDSPALIEPAILLAEGTTSAVLTKTGDETLTLRCANVNPANSQQPAFGVSVQEGDLNVLAGTKFPSVALGEDGRIVIDCDGYAGTYYTIVEPGGSVTFPEDADLTKLIVPVGQGSSKYAASYSPETGLVLGPNYALAEAEINGVRYPTLELAAENVKKDETITVLRDIVYEEARTVTIPVAATLDLNGHSITFYDWYELNGANEWRTTDSIVFQQGGAIKNGSLLEPADTVNITDYTYAGNARVVVGDGENTATLTVENLTVGDAAGHEPFCVFRANKGARVVVSNGIYHAATLFASIDGSSICEIQGGNFYLRGYHYCCPDGATNFRNGEFYVYGGAFSLPPDAYYVKDNKVIQHDVTNTELPYSVVSAAEAPYTATDWSYHYTDQAAAEAAVVAKRTVDGAEVFYTSIADAFSAAQLYLHEKWANGGGEDTITLVADVTAFDRPAVADLWTGNNLLIDGAGHTVKVRTPYVAETGYVASDFTLEFRYLFNTKSGNTTMRDIHIMAGGMIDSHKSSGEFYAILNDNTSRLKLENVTITRSNGAIMNSDAYLYAEDCRFVRNCRYCAGGIFNQGVAVLERSSLSENRSLASGGGGGAIENPGMLYVNNCVFCNNSSTEIGGAINNYSSWRNVGLYMMNTTIAGNFSAVSSFASHCKDPGYEYYGGGIGLRAHQSETFLGVNNLIIDNYQVQTSWDGDKIWTSDISALCETIQANQDIYPIGMTNRLFYSVYQTFTHEANTVLNGCVLELENNRDLQDDQTAQNVFNAYYASRRIYQNAVETTVDVNGAQLVSKDDGSLNAELARYAPIKRTSNGDGTYSYGDAVLGTDGVYTFFDASDWTNGIVRMGYATVVDEVAYGDDDELAHAGDIVPLGDVPVATAEYMVTNYYERIGGRSFGVTGASGWLEDDTVYYTVRLAREPENGSATGITLYGDTYADGTIITLTATPGFAREFLGWYIVDQTTGTETLIEGSNKTIWELTVDQDYVLVPKFSDILEYLTPEPSVHAKMADDDPTDGPSLYPITVTTKWMTDHYSDIIPDEDTSFIDYLAHMVETGTVEVAKAWLSEILEETDPVTGLKMWQDYVLGIEPGDASAKIWINSPQYSSTGKNLIRMEMNKLTPVKGSKFTINYRLDKQLGAATEFSRSDVNATGSYDVNVATDPSGLYVIDVLFIPEGKATSEEYVTTVNTAGLLRVANSATRAALAVPWTKLQPSGSSAVSALDLVKTANLTPGDILYVYDCASENRNYRAWKMLENGNWSPLNVFQLDDSGFVNTTGTDGVPEGSAVARGLGLWLERANTNDYIYLCGQYENTAVNATELSEGWNLVGNPGLAPFDLTPVFEKMDTGDQIIVPTAGAPLNCTYKNGSWGYTENVEVKDGDGNVIGVRPTRRRAEGLTVPVGLGFWYIKNSTGSGNIEWEVQ